jgi:hypothetical protein
MMTHEYLKRYPWSRGYDPYPEDKNEESCTLDWIPEGWEKAFGEIMCEEFEKVIKENNLTDDFRIDEMKEKYGSLRIFCHPCTPAINNSVNTFEMISEAVCGCCGSIEGVKLVPWGWVFPYCRRCFGKIHRTTDFSKFDALPDQELPIVVKWTRYSKNGTEHFELDISETTQKIRERYAERKANGEFESDDFAEWEDNYYGA